MATATPTLVLQPRDIAVLACLGEHGLLETDSVHERHFAGVSRRRCLQRLAQYQQQGLPRVIELAFWTGAGNRRSAPTVHVLTPRGAEVLESLIGSWPARLSKSDPQSETISHRLDIIHTKLAWDDACDRLTLTRPQWIFEQDRNPHASQQLPPSQRRLLYHAFPGPPVITCQPDAACRLAVPRDIANPTIGTSDLIGLFEIDRSTEGHKQILRKLPGYEAVIRTRDYRRYFPHSDQAIVRVFWVCQTWSRIRSLCETLMTTPSPNSSASPPPPT